MRKQTAPTILIAALMALLSLAGLIFPPVFYPTEELKRSFIPNDVVNLLLGMPILLISLALARREKLLGVLLLPGALLYVAYNYIAYSIATWVSVPSLFYIALAGLSLWGVNQCFANMEKETVHGKLQGSVPNRFAGGVLTVFGLLFFLRAVAEFFDGTAGMSEFGVLIADLLITPLWILGGLSLWRKQAFGYTAGAALLFQASMLFVGLLVFFILQPFLTGAPFPMNDFVVIFGMGLVFFVPLGLFVQGILKSAQE